MTCNYCEWFVEETNIIGDYQHSEAKQQQKGFCLIQDLFTAVDPNQKACSDFQMEKE